MSNRIRTPLLDDLPHAGVPIDERGARTLARTLYRALRARGVRPHHLLQMTTELIALLTSELRETRSSE